MAEYYISNCEARASTILKRPALNATSQMPPKRAADASFESPKPKKCKELPQTGSNSPKASHTGRSKRAKTIFDSRTPSIQNVDAALKNGELDLQSFLKAREFEIKALEDGMQEAKSALRLKAFQQLPRDMRRRTASHNVKRVPKRMQKAAKREMVMDNTPSVYPSKRTPRNSRGRIRAETAKRLGMLAAKKRATKSKDGPATDSLGIDTRPPRPKIRKGRLNDPPKSISKFRKRQVHKTWLPTHLWHAKRAKMTEPKNPLWRFSIPITSTEKSYRPTHRASGARGAVAWDMSYMSTICLEGYAELLGKIIKAMGVTDAGLWVEKGDKWRSGKRSWSGWLTREFKEQSLQIGPSTIVWCPPDQQTSNADVPVTSEKSPIRKLFIRIHPSAFLETWTELLRLSKLQRPTVTVTDLRFEIGSIDITGPGSTEAILGILHPYPGCEGGHDKTFRSLVGVTNPGSLPSNSILSFQVMDPRLRYPPRPMLSTKCANEEADFALLEMLSAWPADSSPGSPALFDRNVRFKASRLPSQKSINRRKSLTPPGSYPSIAGSDPQIPIMLLASRPTSTASAQGTWTILAPWKCILPIWHGIIHCPLSSGGNPRFGGLQEIRQIHFEHGIPWFPADHPGTSAGYAWEGDERQRRKAHWNKRPKGKRIEWGSLDLGAKRKGEIGIGWACDFERMLEIPSPSTNDKTADDYQEDTQKPSTIPTASLEMPVQHVPTKTFTTLLSSMDAELPSPSAIATVRLTLTSRGIAIPCARIYRLPSTTQSKESTSETSTPPTIREEWLSLLPAQAKGKALPNPKSKSAKASTRIPLDAPLPQRKRLLAQSLLQPLVPTSEEDGHPLVPNEDDLVGFVTTGEFNLAEGKGVALGSISVAKAVEGLRREREMGAKGGRLCIVRNAGEKLGRLARWEPV